MSYISWINTPTFGDIWVYLSWVREFLGGDRINGWLLEKAAFSRVSGVDPVDLVFSYLNLALVVVALLAFYALARTLFKSEKAALFCRCLYALFFWSTSMLHARRRDQLVILFSHRAFNQVAKR